jgi:hypothetical protein
MLNTNYKLIIFIIILLILYLIIYLINTNKSISEFSKPFNLNNKEVAIILHVGNINILDKLIQYYPLFFNNDAFDYYITCNSESVKFEITKQIPLKSKVFVLENKGMDIGPFLFIIKYIKDNNLNNYDYYIKLHTKTDNNWRNSLIKPIYDNLNEIIKDDTNDIISMYGSEKYKLDINILHNYDYVLDIIKRNYPEYISIFLSYCKYSNKNDCTKKPYFIGGTIFMFNKKYFDLISKIKDINYEISILEPGYSVNDDKNPRKTHAWEYLFGYLVYLNNQSIIAL